MASTPHQCLGVAGKICSFFLSVKIRTHILFTPTIVVRVVVLLVIAHCADCRDWADEKWEKVSAYHEKLAVQWENSFSPPSIMPITLSNLTSDSFDKWVTMTSPTSNVCTAPFVMTLLVVSVKPYISHKPLLRL